jgi:hypothetical protein
MGLWIELIGVVLLVGMLEVSLFALINQNKPLLDRVGPFGFLGFFLPLVAGTLLIVAGRLRMLSLPSGTGASPVLVGAAVLSSIRALALLTASILTVLAGFEWLNKGPVGEFTEMAVVAYFIALIAGLVAEDSMIPGMAVAGGAIPSRRLLRQAGIVAFVLQLIGLLYVGAVSYVYYANLAANVLQPNPPPAAAARPAAAGGGLTREERWAILMVVCLVVLALQVGYTYLHYSLYAAGQAGASGHERAR